MASHRLKAAAVSVVRQQGVPWSPQEKKNRKQEELGDWLTFPVHAVVVDPEAVVLLVSDACVECGVPPGGCPHFHPMGKGHTAERRCPVGSPERQRTHEAEIIQTLTHKLQVKGEAG